MTELKLNLPEKTIKKLRAYAMLTGSGVKDLEGILIDIVDKTLTDGIVSAMSDLDGGVPPAWTANANGDQVTFSRPIEQSDVETVPDAEPPVVSDDLTGNELSEEDSPDEVRGLDEEEEPISDEELKVDISAPNAGNNADAYLNAVFAAEKSAKKSSGRTRTSTGGFQSGARKAFNPSSPRVTISEHTGDESAEPTLF